MDRVVIETLFRNELHNDGIVVSSFSGIGNITELLADPLLAFTAAKVAVLVDNVQREAAERLKRDRRYRKQALRDSGELGALARVLTAAERSGKEVEPVPHPEKDIFDLLDDEALRTISPRWPGHEHADRELEGKPGRRRSGAARKDFYKNRYGLEVSAETCKIASQYMADRGIKPSALTDVIAQVQRLTFG